MSKRHMSMMSWMEYDLVNAKKVSLNEQKFGLNVFNH